MTMMYFRHHRVPIRVMNELWFVFHSRVSRRAQIRIVPLESVR